MVFGIERVTAANSNATDIGVIIAKHNPPDPALSSSALAMDEQQHRKSRRVTMDMARGGGGPMPPAQPSQLRYSQQSAVQGFRNGFETNADGPFFPIPPVVPGGSIHLSRRQSAPGFYSRQEPLSPARFSPHVPGMSFIPRHLASRRGSMAPGHMPPFSPPNGFMSHMHSNAFPSLPPMPPVRALEVLRKSNSMPAQPSKAESETSEDNDKDKETTPTPSSPTKSGEESGSPEESSAEEGEKAGKKSKQPRVQNVVSFPVKLYEILMDKRHSEYITWLPHGRAWRILKQKSFEKEVIPKHFRSARYASFMRQVSLTFEILSCTCSVSLLTCTCCLFRLWAPQVNGWGFKRITEGPDLNSYYHESFLRGLPELVSEMRRPQKGELPIRKPRGFPENPDFYRISSIAPLPEVQLIESPEEEDDSKDSKSDSTPSDTPSTPEVPSTPDARTISEPSDDLPVVSERTQRTKRTPQRSPAPQTPPKRRKSEEGDATLFFTDVASVGSWIDAQEDWQSQTMSPMPDPSRSLMGEAVPRELKIPHDQRDALAPPNLASPMMGPPMLGLPGAHVLSKADLTYLAQQNRLLLKQARVMAGVDF